MSDHEFQELETVFEGPVSEATLLRSALGARDIEAFIENENIKVVDPFITGANALEVRLRVSAVDAPAALEALDEMRSGALALDEDEDIGSEDGETETAGRASNWPGWMMVVFIFFGLPVVMWILISIL